METQQQRDNGCVITSLRRKMAAAERRIEHLQRQLDAGDGPGGLSVGAQHFAREEVSMLKAALLAFRYHDASLHPETSVPLALRQLIEELDALDLPGQAMEHDRLARAMTAARRILGDLKR